MKASAQIDFSVWRAGDSVLASLKIADGLTSFGGGRELCKRSLNCLASAPYASRHVAYSGPSAFANYVRQIMSARSQHKRRPELHAFRIKAAT
jgi:hypothetical protein